MPDDQPKANGISAPQWALIAAGVLVGIGIVGDHFFDLLDDLSPRACKHFGIGCEAGLADPTGPAPQPKPAKLSCDRSLLPTEYQKCIEQLQQQ